MAFSHANLFYNSNFNISSSKHLYISIFSFSNRSSCYNSLFHQPHLNKYQPLLLQQRKMSKSPAQVNISSIEFIKSSELVQTLKDTNQVPGKDYLVVDVRDDDYEGGNIPNSVNSPSHKFQDEVNDLISKYNQVPRVIFTCALSQVRGPKCARIYKEVAENKETGQTIQVLQGGMSEWQRQYKIDPKLMENYDADYWVDD